MVGTLGKNLQNEDFCQADINGGFPIIGIVESHRVAPFQQAIMLYINI